MCLSVNLTRISRITCLLGAEMEARMKFFPWLSRAAKQNEKRSNPLDNPAVSLSSIDGWGWFLDVGLAQMQARRSTIKLHLRFRQYLHVSAF